MEYGIRHITRFRYHAPVSETVMEIRLHPRTEGVQRCLNFALSIQPEARGFAHQDYLGNIIDSFDIPVSHSELMITAEAHVGAHRRLSRTRSIPLRGPRWTLGCSG